MITAAARAAAERADEGLLCHCAGRARGHELGAPACVGPQLPATRTPLGYPPIPRRYAEPTSGRELKPKPTGTCSECGTRQPLVLVELRTTNRPDIHDLFPGVTVGRLVEVAPHKAGRAPCRGAGRTPAEIRYPPPPAVIAMWRDFGPESLA